MKNQNHVVINFFTDKRLLGFQSTFPPRYGDTDEVWNLGLNLAALLVSATMSSPAKTAQMLNM